jgi:modulator of FtsH protease HflK
MSHMHSHYEPEPHDLGRPEGPGDPAQESLVRALRASFNVLRVLMVVLVALYLLSGVFRVNPGEQGLVARLGELRTTSSAKGESPIFGPGWHWCLPDPFDKKYILPGTVREVRVTTFMFHHKDAETAKDLSQIVPSSSELTPGTDGAMFTGDRNLSHGRWEVQYQIDDAAQYVQNVGETPADGEGLLRRLIETAVVREVAGRTVEEVTRTALDDVRQSVQTRLQHDLGELETGIRVVQVVAFTVEPGPVRPAFMGVVAAENERLSMQERAEEQANEILNHTAGDKHARLLELINQYGETQARGGSEDELRQRLAAIDTVLDDVKRDGAGQAAVRLSEAEAEAEQTDQSLRREYEEFIRYREQMRARPRITMLGLWVQMRQAVLGNKLNEIFFVPDTKEIEIHIKSDPQRKLELEEESALKRQTGGQ